MTTKNRLDILLVEDNLGDIQLINDALAETEVQPTIRYVRDGIQALQFLRRQAPFEDAPRPAIIILDFNLPRKDGRAVLAEIKSDPALALIPVIVFSGTDSVPDISRCYALGANCCITKPRELYGFTDTIRVLADFWLRRVSLPADPGLDIDETAGK